MTKATFLRKLFPAPTQASFVWLLMYPLTALVASGGVTLAWNPSAGENVAGYRVHYGQASGSYSQELDVGNSTQARLSRFATSGTYYAVVRAYGENGLESPFSNEVAFMVMIQPPSEVPVTIDKVEVKDFIGTPSLELTISGLPGTQTKLEVSDDMQTWEPMGFYTLGDVPTIVNDLEFMERSNRFYRLMFQGSQ